MAIKDEDLHKIRKELEESSRPLFFFDDDPDGLSSFLLFYRFSKEGKGIVVKATPELTTMFSPKVKEYEPDKIFILDKPDVNQDFIDDAKTRIIWIDHHEPKKRQNVSYYNPRIDNDKDNRPTSYWCYRVVEQDMWIAMVGIVGDWFIPEFADLFSEKYPELLPPEIKKPEEALYKTEIGRLARIFSFILKGRSSDALACVKVLTRIESPYEILRQETPAGKFIYKKYMNVSLEYDKLFSAAKKLGERNSPFLVYTYSENRMSFTGDLSNELLFTFPQKIIIVGREKSGEMKCSLRSADVKLEPLLKKALVGIDGYGGGHEMACGTCVKNQDWKKFLEQLKTAYNEALEKKQ
jgi:single-stranded DNA-specific DHH superfamily exonuclease